MGRRARRDQLRQLVPEPAAERAPTKGRGPPSGFREWDTRGRLFGGGEREELYTSGMAIAKTTYSYSWIVYGPVSVRCALQGME